MLQVFRDFAISIDTPPDDDRFGFSVVGGKDEGFQCRVDEVHPGETDSFLDCTCIC